MAEAAVEGVVRDAAREEVTFEVTANGVGKDKGQPFNPAAHGARPATAAETEEARRSTKRVDLNNEEELRRIFSGFAERVGMHDEAAAIRGEQLNKGFMAKVKRVGNTHITLKHVAALTVIATGLWLVYEGVAYVMEWPRLLTGNSPVEKTPVRRIAA